MEESKSVDIGEKTALTTDSTNVLCIENACQSDNSIPDSQVVYLDGGIIDGQDIRIPQGSVSVDTDTIASTNSLLQNTNQHLQRESMVIDAVERHASFDSTLISPDELGISSTSITNTSNDLIIQTLALSRSHNIATDGSLDKASLFTNQNLPTNCPLASIDKKISEIEATINIMERSMPSSSRIIFEENIFPSTSHEHDESNDSNLQLNGNQENINSNLTETASIATDDSQSVTMGSEWFKAKKIELYTEDNGPKMYDVTSKYVTPPLIPKRLTEVFNCLPIFGRPTTKADLGEFQMDKIREFVSCSLNDQEFEALMDYCSPEHLKTGRELTVDAVSPGHGFLPIYNNSMDTSNEGPELSLHRKHKLRMRNDVKNNYVKRLKYRGTRMMPLNQEDDDTPPQETIEEPLEPGKDILFRVRVYRPFRYSPIDKYLTRTRHSVFSNDIVLLGRHKLSQLRDRIMCCNDVDMRVDVSDTPDDLPPTTAKDVFPSGFLFINNVFYVDSRKGCSDYSAPLRRWAANKGIGLFTALDMCSVRLDELVIKLGHPEVYVHQGGCEHLFVFSGARLLAATDPARPAVYPRHTALAQNQTVYCTTCAEYAAKWIVVGCAGVPFDPAFFCDKCFKLYLYKDGQKIGEFKAYLYRGNEIK